MVGVDLSDQMLEEAMDKRYESGLNIQYLMQDTENSGKIGSETFSKFFKKRC